MDCTPVTYINNSTLYLPSLGRIVRLGDAKDILAAACEVFGELRTSEGIEAEHIGGTSFRHNATRWLELHQLNVEYGQRGYGELRDAMQAQRGHMSEINKELGYV